jgi:hypothetical protein
MAERNRNMAEPDGTDPFLEEVRELKREALRRAGGGIEDLLRHLREVEDSHRDRVVSPRAETVAEDPPTYDLDKDRPEGG